MFNFIECLDNQMIDAQGPISCINTTTTMGVKND